jgi:hypothetical protein
MVLILKKKYAMKITEYRPISLIGRIYKVISKVPENRLKCVIGFVISNMQSAFISGRQIFDGILISYKIADEPERKYKEVMLFKVDFEKTYDSIDWNFLDVVMSKMGFHEKWKI